MSERGPGERRESKSGPIGAAAALEKAVQEIGYDLRDTGPEAQQWDSVFHAVLEAAKELRASLEEGFNKGFTEEQQRSIRECYIVLEKALYVLAPLAEAVRNKEAQFEPTVAQTRFKGVVDHHATSPGATFAGCAQRVRQLIEDTIFSLRTAGVLAKVGK